MPCNDKSADQTQPDKTFFHDYSQPKRSKGISYEDMIKRERYLDAIVCALVKTMRETNTEHLIEYAEKTGQVNIKAFILEHDFKDKERIKKEMLKYSEHELQIIKKLLE